MAEMDAEHRAEGMLAAERIVTDVAREFEEQAGRAGSAAERSHFETSAAAASKCVAAVRGARQAVADAASPTNELGRLADHILVKHGGLRKGESIVDATIRLLGGAA